MLLVATITQPSADERSSNIWLVEAPIAVIWFKMRIDVSVAIFGIDEFVETYTVVHKSVQRVKFDSYQ